MSQANRTSALPAAHLLLLALLLTAQSARGDGMIVAPWRWELYEAGQVALIVHDAENDLEDLHIVPKFYGQPTDFAWIVPVPTVPEVSASDFDMFEELARLTEPVYRHRDGAFDCEGNQAFMPDGGTPPLEILDEQSIGYYRTLTVRADEASALTDSLAAWGFLHDGNREAIEPILQDYVERQWVFVAMRVDSAAFAALEPDYQDYYGGSIEPVRLSFASAEPVYPLLISRVSAAAWSEVLIFTVADRRLDFPGAVTQYANRLGASELAAIAGKYPAGAAPLREGAFLTRLHRGYRPEEMDADLVLTVAADQSEFLRIYYSGFPATGALLLLCALAALRPWRRPALIRARRSVRPGRPPRGRGPGC